MRVDTDSPSERFEEILIFDRSQCDKSPNSEGKFIRQGEIEVMPGQQGDIPAHGNYPGDENLTWWLYRDGKIILQNNPILNAGRGKAISY